MLKYKGNPTENKATCELPQNILFPKWSCTGSDLITVVNTNALAYLPEIQIILVTIV